jgi:hypothetical protein
MKDGKRIISQPDRQGMTKSELRKDMAGGYWLVALKKELVD